jgi:DnaJ-class molecular chaperone
VTAGTVKLANMVACHACKGSGYVIVTEKTTTSDSFYRCPIKVVEKQLAQRCPVCDGKGAVMAVSS